MSLGGGGVWKCNKKLRVCVARTISGKGIVEGGGNMIEELVCVWANLGMYVLHGRRDGIEGAVYSSESTHDIGPSSDSSEKESEAVSHESVSSSQ